MNWINLQVSIIRSPAYVGSNPTERATWFNVLAYCIEHENGGRLQGAAHWKDRQWQQTCGVTFREVKAASKLVSIECDDVVVYAYPVEKESEVQAKREAGRLGGLAKTQAKIEAARANGAQAHPKHEPKQNPSSDPTEGERKDKGKGNNLTEPASPPPRKRNELMDELATIAGIPLSEIGQAVAARLNKVLTTIKQSSPDVTPDEIKKRAENYKTHFSVTLTPEALGKHWSACHEASERRDNGGQKQMNWAKA